MALPGENRRRGWARGPGREEGSGEQKAEGQVGDPRGQHNNDSQARVPEGGNPII